MPDAWYRERYRVPPEVSAYLRPLSSPEVLGILHYNLGNAFRLARRLDEALAHYARAGVLFPDYPEAHASRGLALQLLGDLDGAWRAYARARALHPRLAGLDDNLTALEREEKERRGR